MTIFKKLLDKRLRETIENTLEESQSGFRSRNNTQDHIFALKQIAEKARQEERIVYLAFIDLEKAFDMVPREKIWTILRERGVNNKLRRVMRNIYNCNVNSVIKDNMRSKPFKTERGLRQGGSLSPILDEIIKKCTAKSKKFSVGYKNLQTIEISERAFADDVVLIAKNRKRFATIF